jgi:hypothetical protein
LDYSVKKNLATLLMNSNAICRWLFANLLSSLWSLASDFLNYIKIEMLLKFLKYSDFIRAGWNLKDNLLY